MKQKASPVVEEEDVLREGQASPLLRGNSHRIERSIPAVELWEGLFKNRCKSWLIALKWRKSTIKCFLWGCFILKLLAFSITSAGLALLGLTQHISPAWQRRAFPLKNAPCLKVCLKMKTCFSYVLIKGAVVNPFPTAEKKTTNGCPLIWWHTHLIS